MKHISLLCSVILAGFAGSSLYGGASLLQMRGTYNCMKHAYRHESPLHGCIIAESEVLRNMYLYSPSVLWYVDETDPNEEDPNVDIETELRVDISSTADATTRLVHSLFKSRDADHNLYASNAIGSIASILTPKLIGLLISRTSLHDLPHSFESEESVPQEVINDFTNELIKDFFERGDHDLFRSATANIKEIPYYSSE